jgi:hypothetical protein
MMRGNRIAGECTPICYSFASDGQSCVRCCWVVLIYFQTTKDGRLTVPLVLINWYAHPRARTNKTDRTSRSQGTLLVPHGTDDASYVWPRAIPAGGRMRTGDRDA